MKTEKISAKKRSRCGRPKKNTPTVKLFKDELLDIDIEGDDSPFLDEELTTLDEFESLSGEIEKERSAPVQSIPKEENKTAKVLMRRKKVARRRQIDPATCERDYTQDEVEFMNALNEYKRSSGRMFPTCSEILEVLKNLGYEKNDSLS